MQWRHSKKSLGFLAISLFVLTGTYNSVVINSESDISAQDIRFVKRLDEVYGVVTPGRMVAAYTSWKKLSNEEVRRNSIVQVVEKLDSAPVRPLAQEVKEDPSKEVAAAVQEDLELNLTEVINPKKWQQGLPAGNFSGELATSGGIIESLNVILPNGEGISVSFAEMNGNVFEYDLDGEIFSGMLYEVDPKSYMVTLSNGPLEGTRMRFTKPVDESQLDYQQELAQNHQIETGNLGAEQAQGYHPEEISQYDQAVQAQAIQANSYNMEQPQTF